MRKLLYTVALFVIASACSTKSESKPYNWEDDLHQRLLTDFCMTESQVKDYIRKYIPDVTDEQMRQLLDQVRQEYDYCLIDAPAGLGQGFRLATGCADCVVVITTTDASALRDAQHTVMELDRFPSGALHLVVNRVRKKLLRQLHATIDDAIDKAGLPLLGVVPEDDALPLCMNRGVPILLADGQSAATAYRNIAKRLQGERVPLLRIR